MDIRRLLAAVVVCLTAGVVCTQAHADKVFLNNGRSIECLAGKEGGAFVDLDVGFGKMVVAAADIQRIERYSPQDNQALAERWKRKKVQDEKSYQEHKEQEAKAQKAAREAAERAPKTVKAGQSIGGSIVVEALLDDKVKARLVVDTGSGLVVVSQAVARQLGVSIPANSAAAAKNDVIAESTVADGRKVQSKLFNLKSVQVQDVSAANVPAAVMLAEVEGKEFDGLLGMSFLSNFKFSLNAKEGTLVLEKHK